MLTPEELERIPTEIGKIFNELESRLMIEIVKRLKALNSIGRTTDYQIYRLTQISGSTAYIRAEIQKALNASDEQMKVIYDDIIAKDYARDKSIYDATNTTYVPFEENEQLQQLITAIKAQTMDEFRNITGSMGFKTTVNGSTAFSHLLEYYQNTLDSGIMDITTGVKDYNTVIRETVTQMVNGGITKVDYESGRAINIVTATRNALMTGLTQVTNHINESNAEKLKTEHFEVSWHGTARPDHQVWQGRVYKREDLINVCGLGSITGLSGINCRHSYRPFVIGVSTRNYTDEQLDELNRKENELKEYNGKMYNAYQATQKQRQLEDLMRKQRKKIKLLEEGGSEQQDIVTAKAKYRATSQQYTSFSKKMELPQQRERVYADGLGRLI